MLASFYKVSLFSIILIELIFKIKIFILKINLYVE